MTQFINRKLGYDFGDVDDEIPAGSQLVRNSRFTYRMKQRSTKKFLMVYPEDKFKNSWDSFLSLTLVVMFISTPIYIAFHDN